MAVVLDACAMIAYLRNEAGADVVDAALADDSQTCLAHAINVCEVYYDFLRVSDQTTAKAAVDDLLQAGLVIREDLDRALWQDIGHYKVQYRLSLADCVALALAQRLQASLVTSDHHEFDPLAAAGICSFTFIR
ncbi:MAG TPA: PIN domain-containing protein [Armatimonadota bacterium]